MSAEQLQSDGRLYMMFVSIVFGVFIAVWLEPVAGLFPINKKERAISIEKIDETNAHATFPFAGRLLVPYSQKDAKSYEQLWKGEIDEIKLKGATSVILTGKGIQNIIPGAILKGIRPENNGDIAIDIEGKNAKISVPNMINASFIYPDLKDIVRGILVFFVLICLWWWHAWFLGHVHPAQGFFMFFLDFVSLCAFAMGFRFWSHPILFPVVVILACVLMAIRFLIAFREVDSGSKEQRALFVAVGILALSFAAAVGALMMHHLTSEPKDVSAESPEILEVVDYGIMALLSAAFILTIIASIMAEGWNFGNPRDLKRKHSDVKTTVPPT